MVKARAAAAPAGPRSVWCFYVVQNEAGDSDDHPNAFRVKSAGGSPTLADVRAGFPLNGTGSFHFRFRCSPDGSKDAKSFVYLDAVHDSDEVPLLGSNIFARVLRLDKLTCVSRRSIALRRRPVARQALPATRGSGAPAAPAASASASDAGASVAIIGGRPAREKSPEEEADDALPPLRREELDGDLRDREDLVVASRVQRRRNRERRAVGDRVGAVHEGHAQAEALEDELFRLRAEVRPQLEAWAYEPGGGLKDVRALLVRLPEVLWEGCKWKPVTMAQVMAPDRVKRQLRVAQLVLHPDKVRKQYGARARVIAEGAFDTLQTAFAKFEAENP